MSWGLGHATRSVPVIKRLLKEQYEVTLSATGRALILLKNEFGQKCGYIDIPDIPHDWGRDIHWLRLLPHLPKGIKQVFSAINVEERRVQDVVNNGSYDLLISDNCYGAWTPEIPCYFISHHLKVHWFWRISLLQRASEWAITSRINRFAKIIVPDYIERPLSGNLSHDLKYIDSTKVHYIGILSGCKRKKVDQDIDYLISLSGPEPQRTGFQELVENQIQRLKGKVVLVLGIPSSKLNQYKLAPNIRVYPFIYREARDDILNRSKIIIARSGYSTLMDMLELGKKRVLFVPTRNQTEQEYLASYHMKEGRFYSVPQHKLNIVHDVQKAYTFSEMKDEERYSTEESVNQIIKIIKQKKKQRKQADNMSLQLNPSSTMSLETC